MRHAVGRLTPVPELALVDGEELTGTACPSRGIVRGDSRSLSIACASVVAKVFRDRLMRKLAGRFPGYALERNVGYGTPAHLAALRSLGPCPLHRRSFAPVARMALGLTA
jgi:ribonuclease HII